MWAEIRPTPAHAPAPTPAPTTLSVVQQDKERFRGESQCCTSSVVAGSATSSRVEDGSGDSSTPAAEDPVDESEPVVLQPPSRAETTNQRQLGIATTAKMFWINV